MMLQRYNGEIYTHIYSMNEANRFCFLVPQHCSFTRAQPRAHAQRTRSYITLHPIDSFISTNMLVSVLTEIGLMWQCQSIAMKEPIEMIHKWISLGLRSVRFLSILRAFTNAHNCRCRCCCHCHWNSGIKSFRSTLENSFVVTNSQQTEKNRSRSISTLFLLFFKKKRKMCAQFINQ